MAHKVTLAEQVDILIENAKARGVQTSYQAIADAIGEGASPGNIFNIHRGHNTNPGVKTLTALVDFFGTDIGYFKCETRQECLAYLQGTVPEKELEGLALRAEGISESGLEAIRRMIDVVRQAEGLPVDGNKKGKSV